MLQAARLNLRFQDRQLAEPEAQQPVHRRDRVGSLVPP
jgi:hypothetical protein